MLPECTAERYNTIKVILADSKELSMQVGGTVGEDLNSIVKSLGRLIEHLYTDWEGVWHKASVVTAQEKKTKIVCIHMKDTLNMILDLVDFKTEGKLKNFGVAQRVNEIANEVSLVTPPSAQPLSTTPSPPVAAKHTAPATILQPKPLTEATPASPPPIPSPPLVSAESTPPKERIIDSVADTKLLMLPTALAAQTLVPSAVAKSPSRVVGTVTKDVPTLLKLRDVDGTIAGCSNPLAQRPGARQVAASEPIPVVVVDRARYNLLQSRYATVVKQLNEDTNMIKKRDSVIRFLGERIEAVSTELRVKREQLEAISTELRVKREQLEAIEENQKHSNFVKQEAVWLLGNITRAHGFEIGPLFIRQRLRTLLVTQFNATEFPMKMPATTPPPKLPAHAAMRHPGHYSERHIPWTTTIASALADLQPTTAQPLKTPQTPSTCLQQHQVPTPSSMTVTMSRPQMPMAAPAAGDGRASTTAPPGQSSSHAPLAPTPQQWPAVQFVPKGSTPAPFICFVCGVVVSDPAAALSDPATIHDYFSRMSQAQLAQLHAATNMGSRGVAVVCKTHTHNEWLRLLETKHPMSSRKRVIKAEANQSEEELVLRKKIREETKEILKGKAKVKDEEE